MSMRLMVAVLKARVGNSGRKLVLLKLADHANDKGECWPSYQYIADDCEMGRSTVKAHIKTLMRDGFITVVSRNDGKSSNQYLLHLDSVKSEENSAESNIKPGLNLTRSKSNPVKTQRTRSDSDPLTRSDSDPRTYHSSEPVKEPDNSGELSTRAAKKSKSSLDYRSWPQEPSAQVLSDWLAFRKSKRAPVTQTVVEQMGHELRLAVQHGFSVDQCLSVQQMAGWQGYKFEWHRNRESKNANSNQSDEHGFHSAGSPTKLSTVSRNSRAADAILERVAREQAESHESYGEFVETSR